MTASSVAALDDEEVQDWDQFILRFTKLQDAIGSRLFTALLEYLLEPAADQPMIDRLNRLEKLGYIERADIWQVLRSIRKQFTHDYLDDDALRAAALNEAVGAANVHLTRIERDLLSTLKACSNAPLISGQMKQTLGEAAHQRIHQASFGA